MKIPSFAPRWWISPRILFVLGFLSFGVAMAVDIAFWKYSSGDISTKIDFVAKTAFGCAAVLSLLVGYQTLRLNIHQRQIQAAFEFLARYDKDDEKKARRRVEALVERTGTLKEYFSDQIPAARVAGFVECLEGNDQLDEAVTTVLAYFEDVALALRSGYASEAIVFRSIHPSAIKMVNALRPYIVHLREKENEPAYYEDALAMVQRWERRLSIRTSDQMLRGARSDQ